MNSILLDVLDMIWCYLFLELAKLVTEKKEADGYRLPNEKQWECAARGGEAHLYSGSNDLTAVGWYSSNSGYTTQPVGQKKANGFGLYDMSGNVFEWCFNEHLADYNISKHLEGKGAVDRLMVGIDEPRRIIRGGCWNDAPRYNRVSYRIGDVPSARSEQFGFRVVRQ